MKLKNIINLKGEWNAEFELAWTFKNIYNEPLKIVNFQTGAVFEDCSIYSDRGEPLLFESVPTDNGHLTYYAVYFNTPVPAKKEYSFVLKAKSAKKYFDLSTIKKSDIYYWTLYDEIGRENQYYQEINFYENFTVVDVDGVEPVHLNENQVVWDIDALEDQVFQSTVTYKRLD